MTQGFQSTWIFQSMVMNWHCFCMSYFDQIWKLLNKHYYNHLYSQQNYGLEVRTQGLEVESE